MPAKTRKFRRFGKAAAIGVIGAATLFGGGRGLKAGDTRPLSRLPTPTVDSPARRTLSADTEPRRVLPRPDSRPNPEIIEAEKRVKDEQIAKLSPLFRKFAIEAVRPDLLKKIQGIMGEETFNRLNSKEGLAFQDLLDSLSAAQINAINSLIENEVSPAVRARFESQLAGAHYWGMGKGAFLMLGTVLLFKYRKPIWRLVRGKKKRRR